MNTIQGGLVPLELSFDNEATWQVLVCLKQYNIPLQLPVTQEDTFCGQAVGVGNPTFNPTGTAVVEKNPSAGSQVTMDRLIAALANKETFKFRARYPTSGSTGGNIFLKGDCMCTEVNPTVEAVKYIEFTFTLTGVGLIDYQNP